MAQTAAVAAIVVLAALAVLQVALAAGAPLGRYAWGGGQAVLPVRLRVGSALSVVLYVLIAVVLLDRSGSTDLLPEGFVRPATWVVLAYFVLGTGLNAISRSRREALVMAPTCLVLAALTLVVATS